MKTRLKLEDNRKVMALENINIKRKAGMKADFKKCYMKHYLFLRIAEDT